jgi:formate--tetrahydrofolate ligase
MLQDFEIAERARLRPIGAIARKLGLKPSEIEVHGKFKAKIPGYAEWMGRVGGGEKLILVTAINPTPAGEGKTTTAIGLADALGLIGKSAVVALREPSLGPVFGIKGGATGGGYSQVGPMDEINLHFTGDIHAVGAANNLLAALLDNHIKQGNRLRIDPRSIMLKRVLDLNDRQLRNIVDGLESGDLGQRIAAGLGSEVEGFGGLEEPENRGLKGLEKLGTRGTEGIRWSQSSANGLPRADGFEITVASEIMAILCLAESLSDLKSRLGKIIVASNSKGESVTAADLKATGAMAALLKDAIKPNLVQTLAGTPALIHGGPFANIAHGCNSVIATKTACGLIGQLAGADGFVVTEAGFGADLGAEKFIDLKCQMSGLFPNAVVLVATVRALKSHGGVERDKLDRENLPALTRGLPNLLQHIDNLQSVYGVPLVVALNRFASDTSAEVDFVQSAVAEYTANSSPLTPVKVLPCNFWASGGAGGTELAQAIVSLTDTPPPQPRFAYRLQDSLSDKIRTIATRIYRADTVYFTGQAQAQIHRLEQLGLGQLPVCIAKTQYSFSDQPDLLGAPRGFTITIQNIEPRAGAGFIVAFAGNILTMPGLPAIPAAEQIDIDDAGRISGIF